MERGCICLDDVEDPVYILGYGSGMKTGKREVLVIVNLKYSLNRRGFFSMPSFRSFDYKRVFVFPFFAGCITFIVN